MGSDIADGVELPSTLCLNCGHTWLYHFDYDEYLGRYVASGCCEHYNTCDCKQWIDPRERKEKEK